VTRYQHLLLKALQRYYRHSWEATSI